MLKPFLAELATQRWDDHRFYHQSRVNQSLHFLSAVGFLCAYVLLFVDPPVAALIGWGVWRQRRERKAAAPPKPEHPPEAHQ